MLLLLLLLVCLSAASYVEVFFDESCVEIIDVFTFSDVIGEDEHIDEHVALVTKDHTQRFMFDEVVFQRMGMVELFDSISHTKVLSIPWDYYGQCVEASKLEPYMSKWRGETFGSVRIIE